MHACMHVHASVNMSVVPRFLATANKHRSPILYYKRKKKNHDVGLDAASGSGRTMHGNSTLISLSTIPPFGSRPAGREAMVHAGWIDRVTPVAQPAFDSRPILAISALDLRGAERTAKLASPLW